MTLANEGRMRFVLAHILPHAGEGSVPPPKNRCSPLIKAALDRVTGAGLLGLTAAIVLASWISVVR